MKEIDDLAEPLGHDAAIADLDEIHDPELDNVWASSHRLAT